MHKREMGCSRCTDPGAYRQDGNPLSKFHQSMGMSIFFPLTCLNTITFLFISIKFSIVFAKKPSYSLSQKKTIF